MSVRGRLVLLQFQPVRASRSVAQLGRHGLEMVQQVGDAFGEVDTSLVFTNRRSQCENGNRFLLSARRD